MWGVLLLASSYRKRIELGSILTIAAVALAAGTAYELNPELPSKMCARSLTLLRIRREHVSTAWM